MSFIAANSLLAEAVEGVVCKMDSLYRGRTRFRIGEVAGRGGTCLGYSKHSTKGHAFGPILSGRALGWAAILKRLPLFDDPQTLAMAANQNADLRNRVNQHISEIFKVRTKSEKVIIKRQAMQSGAAFQAFLDALKLSETTPYDLHRDPEGLLQWSPKRRLDYVHWARDVVAGLRGTSLWLEQQFDEAAARAEASLG